MRQDERGRFLIGLSRASYAAYHRAATSLLGTFRADAAWVTRHIGENALADLLGAHELWCRRLGGGRDHKYAVVAQKRARP